MLQYGFLKLTALVSLVLGVTSAWAIELQTNSASLHQAPTWLTSRRVERVVDKIQNKLEWDIRRIQVYFYTDAGTFEKLHGFGGNVLAISKPTDHSIHLGPIVNDGNFDAIFGHELVHVILFQKYRGAVPKWLEEGLANFVSQHSRVDYEWLATQALPSAKSLSHPYVGSVNARLHYNLSTALAEMLSAKCSISDLLRLSVGSKLENYLGTFCEISDLDAALNSWVKKKARLK